MVMAPSSWGSAFFGLGVTGRTASESQGRGGDCSGDSGVLHEWAELQRSCGLRGDGAGDRIADAPPPILYRNEYSAGRNDVFNLELESGADVAEWVAVGGAGPGDVGGDLDDEGVNEGDVDGLFVSCEAVEGAAGDAGGPGVFAGGRVQERAERAGGSGV
ncbi:hypothetical protein [Georgenia soli]|uniref:hypothetical protein n=1 Tax=Georgenia soli TaxID=638953 RepID=UPI001FE75ED8|nr:hypothetical protein [Georgenia soli]